MLPYTAGNQYRQQSAMTASPGELTLMLYDGAIRNLKQAKVYIEKRDYVLANKASQKSQNIVIELMSSLDMRYDISKQLYALYDFILDKIVQSNLKKDTSILDTALDFIVEMRETWQQVVKLNRLQGVSATEKTSYA